MKNSLYFGIVSFLLFPLVSCSSDNDDSVQDAPVVAMTENPLPEFLSQHHFDDNTITYIDDNNNYEMGFAFRPLVSGQINSVVLKIPQPNTNIRVTIWDEDNGSVLRTIYVDALEANVASTKTIEPLVLEQNKAYMITMNANDYYFGILNFLPEPLQYPYIYGNISITGSAIAISNSGQEMPAADMINATAGWCSFEFQQAE